MAEERHIIEHEDGRAYSVTKAAFREIYEPEGFTIVRPETPADFIPELPRKPRKRPAKSARRSRAAVSRETPTAPPPATEPEA